MAVRLSTLYEQRLIGRRRQIEANLRAARDLISDAIHETLDVPYPPASRPGEPPRRRTGRLQAGTRVDLDLQAKTISVGNVAPYAVYLIGTRPIFRPTIERIRSRYEATIRRGLPFGGGSV